MFSGAVPLLILLLAGVLFWLDGARARELAAALAKNLCERQGVQFLDDSAALVSLRLARSARGLRLRRVFVFSYYSEACGRCQGEVIVVGARIQAFRLDGATTVEMELD